MRAERKTSFMLETFSDYLSLYVTIFFVIIGLYFLFTVSSKKHEEKVKNREERYFQLLEELDNGYDDDDEYSDEVTVE